MSILYTKQTVPQLRCRVIPGVDRYLFRYEQMIGGQWVSCNHRFVMKTVGRFNRLGARQRKQAGLPDAQEAIRKDGEGDLLKMNLLSRGSPDTATDAALLLRRSGLIQQTTALFSGAQTTIMSAYVRAGNGSKNLSEWRRVDALNCSKVKVIQ